jgi:hypothetical protein
MNHPPRVTRLSLQITWVMFTEKKNMRLPFVVSTLDENNKKKKKNIYIFMTYRPSPDSECWDPALWHTFS